MLKALFIEHPEHSAIQLDQYRDCFAQKHFQIDSSISDGRTALKQLENSSYSLVLTDILIPMLDELQLLREIRQKNLCPCVVLMSEQENFHYAREGIILGAFDFLVKPFREDQLHQVLDRTLAFLNASHTLPPVDDPDYPHLEEKEISQKLYRRDPSALFRFQKGLERLYENTHLPLIQLDQLARKFYLRIIQYIYREYSWLSLYLNEDYFQCIDFYEEGNPYTLQQYYCRKIASLVQYLELLLPPLPGPDHAGNPPIYSASCRKKPESENHR